jgi:hypothetical protein
VKADARDARLEETRKQGDDGIPRSGVVAEFLDLLGATNLIPGPNSTELARA